jgi:hypothetical protein
MRFDPPLIQFFRNAGDAQRRDGAPRDKLTGTNFRHRGFTSVAAARLRATPGRTT